MALRKRSDDEQRDKRMMWGLGSLIAIFFLLWVLFAPGRGFVHYLKLNREIQSLSEENRQLKAKNQELAENIKKLQLDSEYLEQVAREKHGLLKKDEMVFDFNRTPKKK